MKKPAVLVVDDEAPIVRLITLKLESDEMKVRTAHTGQQALEVLEDEPIDLVVLDVTMPGMDGFETLRHIRARSNVPVIMLTARTLDVDKLRGLTSGADDYMTKPFNPDELAARIRAILRRASGQHAGGQEQLVYGAVTIDLAQRRVTRGTEEIHFSRTEWELLHELATNPGKVLLHRELLTRIWGAEFRDESQYLRTWVSRLRSKLGTTCRSPRSQAWAIASKPLPNRRGHAESSRLAGSLHRESEKSLPWVGEAERSIVLQATHRWAGDGD